MVWWLQGAPIRGRWIDSEELDGDISKIECEDMTDDGGTMIRPGYVSAQAGRRIKTEHVPTKLEWRSKAAVSDYKTPMGFSMVSPRFREIVEALEPGVHQWLPLEVVDKKGGHLADRYYFIPCNRIDSADHEHTSMVMYIGGWSVPKDLIRLDKAEFLPTDYDPQRRVQYVFSEAKTAGIHAWRDKHIGLSHLLISDQLAEALQKEKFTGLELRKAESV